MTKLYLFDADATLRRCTVPGQPCPNRPGEWELFPDVKARLAEIDWNTSVAGVVSNQAGVAHGFMTEGEARSMLTDTLVEATGAWCPFSPVMLCPHVPVAGCSCRKPSPRMLLDAARFVASKGLQLAGPEEVLFVGDQIDDYEAARAAGVPFQWAHEFFRWEPEAGLAWEGKVRVGGGVEILARVFGEGSGQKPYAVVWNFDKSTWLTPATSVTEQMLLSQARAGRSFWVKAASGPGPA